MSSLVIRNARVFADGRFFDGGIRVEGSRIVALGADAALGTAEEVIDARGGMLLPGAVDLHVHFRDPGHPEKEDFTSGSSAAALGGVTTVLDMPNTRPAVLDADAFAVKRAAVEGRSYVDYGFIAAADPSNRDAITGLVDAGAAAFKLFLYERRDAPPAGIVDDATLLELMRAIAAAGGRAHVHAENDSLVKAGRAAEADAHDWAAHLRSRPPLVEEEAVSRAIMFAREAGVPLHVCHLSTAAGLGLVRAARRRGQAVTAEATPQHLLLDESGYPEKGADLIMVPPVRVAGDRAALHAGLASGDLDVVATDHAPHTAADKTGEPLRISTGLVGVQWSYPLLLSEALA
ncbi:MAG: dihydroorotase family protein, partial [Protaetiibacter sp.]